LRCDIRGHGGITCQAVRALICRAAADPGRLSFTTALHAARWTLNHGTAAAIQAAADEIPVRPLPGRPPAPAHAPSPSRNALTVQEGMPQPPLQRIHCTATIGSLTAAASFLPARRSCRGYFRLFPLVYPGSRSLPQC